MTTPAQVGGAYLEPSTFLLMEEVLTELFVGGLGDVVDDLRVRLFRAQGVLRRDPSPVMVPGRRGLPRRMITLPVWRMTPHGEVLLRELLDVARAADSDLDRVRARVDDAMTLAGYPRGPERTDA